MKKLLVIILVFNIACTVPKNNAKTKPVLGINLVKVIYQPPPPPYPPEAKAAGIQGNVVVQITVGTDGIPISAKALQGPIELRSTAETYAMKWKFTPALVDGIPTLAKYKLSMPFKLKESPGINK